MPVYVPDPEDPGDELSQNCGQGNSQNPHGEHQCKYQIQNCVYDGSN